jgi:hypothetical protein
LTQSAQGRDTANRTVDKRKGRNANAHSILVRGSKQHFPRLELNGQWWSWDVGWRRLSSNGNSKYVVPLCSAVVRNGRLLCCVSATAMCSAMIGGEWNTSQFAHVPATNQELTVCMRACTCRSLSHASPTHDLACANIGTHQPNLTQNIEPSHNCTRVASTTPISRRALNHHTTAQE